MSLDETLLLHENNAHARTRHLGAFYTPKSTAEILASWAIRSGHESVLEPSAGGGALIEAVSRRAKKIAKNSKFNILAFDIDPVAIDLLKNNSDKSQEIILGDFLFQDPKDYKKYDVVVANPPFIRNHALGKKLREVVRSKFGVPASAGIWASFIVHASSFLKRGGRLTSIVPRSAIFTRHGQKIMRDLCKHFANVGVYALDERPAWSSPADEAGAVLFADGYLMAPAEDYSVGRISSGGEILELLENDSPEYSALTRASINIGEIATLSIGAVTGRNKVFLLSESERISASISLEDVQPVVSRARHVRGVRVSQRELRLLAALGEKTWLLRPRKLSPAVSRYLEIVSAEERESVVWFKKRDPWWRVQTDHNYDAVLTYMNDLGPRVAMLGSGIVCTNTLHRLSFKVGVDVSVKYSAVLTLMSTFGQLAAEKIGRSYGGGVLKFEINEARRLPVLCGDFSFDDDFFSNIDELLKKGCKDAARELIDAKMLPVYFGANWQQAQQRLQLDLTSMRARRNG